MINCIKMKMIIKTGRMDNILVDPDASISTNLMNLKLYAMSVSIKGTLMQI